MASSVQTTAEHILEKIGGADNVTSLTHCATRLRFQLADQSQADVDGLDKIPATLGVVPQGQTGMQVIMGGGVADYYKALKELPGMGDADSRAAQGKKQYGGVRGKYGWIDYSFEFLSDTFRPILWALLGASLIITLMVLLDTFNVIEFRAPAAEQPAWVLFMMAMWKSVFYFLPIMVGACAARKLGANEWVGAAIPAALMTPDFIAMGEKGQTVSVFGLPMVLNDYAGQVFPPLIAAIGLFWVEKGLKKLIPGSVQMVFVPFFSLLIMIPATAFLLGPFGIGVGDGISGLLHSVNEFSPIVLAIIIPLLYPFLVPLGLHWPLNAIMIQNIATLGYDFIQGPMGAWNFACFGTITGCFIVALRDKDRQVRQISLGGMMAGLLGGISEPSLYGVLLRYRKSYLRLLPGCFVGGLVMGLLPYAFGSEAVTTQAFVFTSLLTIIAFKPAAVYIIGIAAAFFTSMFLVIFFDYRTKEEREQARLDAAEYEKEHQAKLAAARGDSPIEPAAPAAAAAPAAGGGVAVKEKPVKTALQANAVTLLEAPLAGRVVSLDQVPDPVFAGGKLGHGLAIDPTGDTIYAPGDGVVIVKQDHAVALRLDNGIELLVHVGLDTVELKGQGFTSHVAQKDRVSAGDPLMSFDRAAIEAAGKPVITPVLVTNTRKFASVEPVAGAEVQIGDELIKITAKPATS
ncbi:glucose PTS transporter subunit IIA [Corynebacterium mendelii]|uniref:PTS glucose transporter subunit IIA n=1 Tax=Corynebacterium mendelii TaxID=2765362 RepID=A0A939IXL2_9CORY|nr:glucose PTS transporter subunit IIA [Corynebacterium mendelii]MBN9644585.1 PTS glucose transporter subunit IIA [Corynebacterium mendelii]